MPAIECAENRDEALNFSSLDNRMTRGSSPAPSMRRQSAPPTVNSPILVFFTSSIRFRLLVAGPTGKQKRTPCSVTKVATTEVYVSRSCKESPRSVTSATHSAPNASKSATSIGVCDQPLHRQAPNTLHPRIQGYGWEGTHAKMVEVLVEGNVGWLGALALADCTVARVSVLFPAQPHHESVRRGRNDRQGELG